MHAVYTGSADNVGQQHRHNNRLENQRFSQDKDQFGPVDRMEAEQRHAQQEPPLQSYQCCVMTEPLDNRQIEQRHHIQYNQCQQHDLSDLYMIQQQVTNDERYECDSQNRHDVGGIAGHSAAGQ